jgi:diadenosine tetraphosphate (Ap4A) HIT family hydrolase
VTGFQLDARLENDTLPLGDLTLSRLGLMDDARFPWLILVPRQPGLREFVDLGAPERAVLMEEIAAASIALTRATGAEKLNVAALGNQVPQLHVHVIARFAGDAAWPSPVWNVGARKPYAAEAARLLGERIRAHMTFV